MDRLSRTFCARTLISSWRQAQGRREPLALRAAAVLPPPGLVRLSFAGLVLGTALGAVLAQEPRSPDEVNPLQWYEIPQAGQESAPSFLRLPPLPLPMPANNRAEAVDEPARPGPRPPVGPDRPHPSLDLSPIPLGPPQPIGRTPGRPAADLSPTPLGPPQRIAPDRPHPAADLSPRLHGPPQRLGSVSARDRSEPASPTLTPAPLGPPQPLQLSTAHLRVLSPRPLGPPQSMRREPSPVTAELDPQPLGPVQRLRRGTEQVAPATPAVAQGPGPAAAASPPAGVPSSAAAVTGSVSRRPTVSRHDGVIVLKVRN